MTGSHVAAQNLALWEGVFSSRSWGRYPPEELIRFVARTFDPAVPRRALRVLEVGCGPGANVWFLRREGFAVAGIDGSPSAIQQATQRLQAEGLWGDASVIDLRQGDFAILPWADESFDAVIDIEAVYANEQAVIRSCLDEVYRVLKPGGMMFSKMFGPKTTGYRTGQEIEPNTFVEVTAGPCAHFGITHFFSEEDVRAAFLRFASLSLDWVHRTDRAGTVEVFEWLVTASK